MKLALRKNRKIPQHPENGPMVPRAANQRQSLHPAFIFLALVIGFCFSFFIAPALATRNASGTYSLPAGNPVVSGTTISSTTHNNTMSDLATEMTDSLNRSGKGGMLAALRGIDGSVSSPSYSWTSDTDTGFYRIGSNNIGMSCGNTKVQDCTATGCTYPYGVVATQATTNGAGITSTGNGSGVGVAGTGGGTNAAGVTGTGGATNGAGVTGAGTGSGSGVTGTGGSSSGAIGVAGTGGSTDGVGVKGTGVGTGVGVWGVGQSTAAGGKFSNGTAATGGTRQDAITLTNGDIDLSGVTYPTYSTGHTNRLGPANIPKAWAAIQTTGGTWAGTVQQGFNVASVTRDSATQGHITLATACADANMVISGQGGIAFGVPVLLWAWPSDASTVAFKIYDLATPTAQSMDGVTNTIGIAVFCKQ